MTTTECHAERPGPYPVLCREPALHRGDHCGSYGGVKYTWENNKELPDRLHANLLAFLEAGGNLTDVATVMQIREAEASAAIDRSGHAQTFTVDTTPTDEETP